MRQLVALCLCACTTAEEMPDAGHRDLIEEAWQTIAAGDAIVAVPGTGTYSDLGRYIDAAPGALPVIRGRDYVGAVEVLEGVLAAAKRAGVGDARFAIWGAGITRVPAFRYVDLDGDEVTFTVIGGTSIAAVGGSFENLLNYNADNADKDARDLYERLRTWNPHGRITLVAHSWGGVVAEYFAANLARYAEAQGPIAPVALVVAAGVPPFVPGFQPFGPGLRTVNDAKTIEIDRPDDPAHTFDPHGNGGGHHYIIRFGEDYRGWYGITTEELSCGDVPGICPPRA